MIYFDIFLHYILKIDWDRDGERGGGVGTCTACIPSTFSNSGSTATYTVHPLIQSSVNAHVKNRRVNKCIFRALHNTYLQLWAIDYVFCLQYSFNFKQSYKYGHILMYICPAYLNRDWIFF